MTELGGVEVLNELPQGNMPLTGAGAHGRHVTRCPCDLRAGSSREPQVGEKD